MYTKEKKEKVLKLYEEVRSVSKIIQKLGYPTCEDFYKWLGDLTEFAIPAGKVYLSPIVDCFDGFITAWTIGKNPNADLVNDMLLKAASTLKKGEKPIVHTDRGCHYR